MSARTNLDTCLDAARPSLNKLDLLRTQIFETSDLEGIKFDLGNIVSAIEGVLAEEYARGEVVDHGSPGTADGS